MLHCASIDIALCAVLHLVLALASQRSPAQQIFAFDALARVLHSGGPCKHQSWQRSNNQAAVKPLLYMYMYMSPECCELHGDLGTNEKTAVCWCSHAASEASMLCCQLHRACTWLEICEQVIYGGIRAQDKAVSASMGDPSQPYRHFKAAKQAGPQAGFRYVCSLFSSVAAPACAYHGPSTLPG